MPLGGEEPELLRIDILLNRIPADVSTVLDVGCGNGLFLHRIRDRSGRGFMRLCGVDRSEAALGYVEC
jgi:predicted TPR repeat methyltransferase